MADSAADSGPGHWVTLPGGHAVYINDASGKAMPPPAKGGAEAVKAGHAYVVAQKQEAAESAAKAASIATNEVKAGGAIITTAKAGTITAWNGYSKAAVAKYAGSIGMDAGAVHGLLSFMGFGGGTVYNAIKAGKALPAASGGKLDQAAAGKFQEALSAFQAQGIKAGNATVKSSGTGGNWKTINGHAVLLDESGGAGQGVKAGGAYVIPSGAKATPAQAVAAQKPAAAPVPAEPAPAKEPAATIPDTGGQHWVTINGHKVLLSDAVAAIDHLAAGGMPSAFKGDQKAMEGVVHAVANYKTAGLGEDVAPETNKLLGDLPVEAYNKFVDLSLGPPKPLGDTEQDVDKQAELAGHSSAPDLQDHINAINHLSAGGSLEDFAGPMQAVDNVKAMVAKMASTTEKLGPEEIDLLQKLTPGTLSKLTSMAAAQFDEANAKPATTTDHIAAANHILAGKPPESFTGHAGAMENVQQFMKATKAGGGDKLNDNAKALEAYKKLPDKHLVDLENMVHEASVKELGGHFPDKDNGPADVSALEGLSKSALLTHAGASGLTHAEAAEVMKALGHDASKMYNAFNAGKKGNAASKLSDEQAKAFAELHAQENGGKSVTKPEENKALTPADHINAINHLTQGLPDAAFKGPPQALENIKGIFAAAAAGKGFTGEQYKLAHSLPPESYKALIDLVTKVQAAGNSEVIKAPPVAEPTNVHTPTKVAFPDSLSQVTEVKSLGGSTGAKLVEDKAGNQFVQKAGKGPAQIKSEYAAEKMYQALGVPVPESKMVTGPNGEPVKLSAYIPDTAELGKLSGKELENAKALASQHFVADALMANWDAAGMEKDNMVLGKDGKLYRIDMGGALAYRAQGAPKGDKFGDVPMELFTLKDAGKNPASADVFSKVSGKDIQGQINNIVAKKDALLAATPPLLQSKMEARLANLEKIGNAYGEAYKAGLSDEQAQSHAFATAEALSKGVAPPKIGEVKAQGAHYSNPVSHAYNAESHLPAPISEKLDAVWNKLAPAEKTGVHAFTRSSYSEMREADQGKSSSYKEHLQNMYKAYEKLPKFEGMIYRGLYSVPLEKLKSWQSGMEYPAEAMSSYSRKLEVARSNFGRTHSSNPVSGKTSVIFKLQSKSARVVDTYGVAAEKEVFVGKGLKMQIDKAYWGTFGDQGKPVWIVEGREVAPAPKRKFKD